ncbi:MAG: tetratricopeptide repeat protein, partial [Planctomycetota bacterium]|nr:tetratricopeptide repeat protein [Planctomycetota bacterium]
MSQPPPLPPDRLRRRAASVERRPLRRRKPWLVPVLVLTVLGLLAGAILVGSELQRGRERRSALRMAHRGMHERAEARLRYWVHADPSDMEARLALADCLLGLERWGEAAEEYEFVAAARADDARAWRGLGGARLELGEEEAAAAALARAQALAPGDAVTSFRLARVHYALGAHFEAEAAARAALAEAPGLGAAK